MIVKNNFKLYPHAVPFWRAVMQNNIRFVICAWARRLGKDRHFFEAFWRRALMNTGNHFIGFPTLVQGKKVLWDSIDLDGKRIFDYIPKELMYGKPNNSTCTITLRNKDNPQAKGSTIQLVGLDQGGDKIRGANPKSLILSEYAWIDPQVLSTLLPAIMRTGGSIWINSTVLGRNHFYDLFNSVADDKAWFTSYLPCYLGRDQNAEYLFDPKELKSIIDSGAISVSKFRQEFLLDWDAAIEGAIFTREMELASIQGRIGDYNIARGVPVSTYLDIGVNKATGSTSIWFVQHLANGNVHFVDYFEDSDQPAEYYVNIISDWRNSNGVTLHKCYLPHDAGNREKITCSTYAARYRELGMPVEIIPRIERKDLAIEASRKFFRNYYIDTKKCKRGIQALREYRKDIMGKTHWANHPVDAFLAVGQWLELNCNNNKTPPPALGISNPIRQSAW